MDLGWNDGVGRCGVVWEARGGRGRVVFIR